ncbi:MAG: antibiotic biosynthesis monooxygenase [Synechococcus sp.]
MDISCVDSDDRRHSSYHVTAVITHRVKPNLRLRYENWISGISAAARMFEGHLGVNILRPQQNAVPDYVIVLRFDTCTHLTAWLQSEVRKSWLEKVYPLIQKQENIQVLTGLESWFELPEQRTPTGPKRYKQAILVWCGVMLVTLCVNPLITPLLAYLPWPLSQAIGVAITVVLLSYVIMPQLTLRLKHWLFS